MNLIARYVIALVACSIVISLGGCQQAPNEALAHPTPPVNNDAMIKQIENDPAMPPDQKAAALGRLKGPAPVAKLYTHAGG